MVDFIALTGNILLFALVFGMSATVDIESLKAQIRNVKAILTGAVCQFVLLPMLGFLVVKMFRLDFAVGLTLLVVTSCKSISHLAGTNSSFQ